MKRTLLGLAAMAVMLSGTAALADHVHSGCHGRPPAPVAPAPQQDGHYELRTTRRWIPERVEQVWVPGRCWGRRFQRCEPGRYMARTVPGTWQDVQEYVWVQDPPRRHRRWSGAQEQYRYDPYTQQYVPVVGATVQSQGSYTVTSTDSAYVVTGGSVHAASPVIVAPAVSASGVFQDDGAQVSAQVWFDPL